jgi:hypothetical protein
MREGRHAHLMGFRGVTSREAMQHLAQQLDALEGALASGAPGGLQSRVDGLSAAVRLQMGAPAASSVAEVEPLVDGAALEGMFALLSQYGEAVGKLAGVFRRNSRDVGVLEHELLGEDAMMA